VPVTDVHAGAGTVRRVLLWEDVVLTVQWLGGLGSAVYLVFFNASSLLSVAATAALAAVLANIVYVNAYAAFCHFKQQPYEHPNQYVRPAPVDATAARA
jgi:membrane protein YdbS with pleckstrin-like domain